MSGRPIRLGKAAGELNVGLENLVEFLGSKGIEIDKNPNTKLTPENYELLCNEFAADQDLKEKSKGVSNHREKRESLSIEDSKAPEEEAPKEEPTSPPLEEKVSKTEEIASIQVPEKDLKVVGKIDLDALNQKAKPEKKATEKPVEESKKDEIKEIEKPQEEAPKEVIETIKIERKKITGPTVLGKIELPVEKPKSPAGSSRPENLNKRKRKRIKKVEVPSPGNKGGGNKLNKQKTAKPEISERDIQKEIKDTLARLSNKGGKSKAAKNRRQKRESVAQKRQEEMEMAELQEKILKLTEFVTVSELASMMSIQPTQVISVCMSLGIFASINQRLDAETIQIVAEEFGYETQFVSAEVQEAIPVVEDSEEDLIDRPPIITVMGHVDHGKTSLLDRIRNANVIDGEAGGITQHIGAYSLSLKDGKKLTFLDTPGHEAFTAMRARGAQVTDVAIIIVAADDDVMPQTKEAISHAQAANVPMVFAINKIDKPGSNADKIKEQLSGMNILVEDWGGKFQCQEISAKENLNIEELLEKVLLEAELLDLKANPNKPAIGTVIEASLDKGKGYVTNMLVQAGTLKIGDVLLVGRHYGRVRAMHDEKGVSMKEAGPSQAISVLGINGAPSAGDNFNVMLDEKEAKSIATKREQLYREQGLRTTKHITLDEIGRRL
ncbi:MAG: translation initiation factor IF-2, partial [Crocinitomicaceae bacterium]|nr:translation initiation factor IF-2 [Crocinitomicaceae bacterium]